MTMLLKRRGPGAQGVRVRKISIRLIGVMAVLAVVGCAPTVKVEAPEKPIVINLNVKIEHEVRVRVEKDVEELFADNPDLF